MSFGTPSSPPPPYGDTNGGNHDGRPSPAADERPAEKQKKNFAQRVFGLLRTHSEPGPQVEIQRTKDLEILVHEASPNILEVAAHRCSERSRRVTVEVQVSASVTVRSRHANGRPAVSTSAAWLVKRTAQAPYIKSTRGHSQSVAFATEKATRKAAEEAHKRAVALATMAAAAKTLEKAATEGRVI